MKKTAIIFSFFTVIHGIIFSQNIYVQNVRGYVLDKDSENPIPGVTVLIPDMETDIFSVSDEFGYFKLENVPVGRINIRAMLIGYNYFELSATSPEDLSTYKLRLVPDEINYLISYV